jgi:hypothetical protein
MNSARLRAKGVLALLCGTAALLFFFPPERYGFYPRCPIFALTHWECPGCGATRALAALLHGRIVEALHFNALFVLLAPLLFGYFAVTYIAAMRPGRFAWPRMPQPLLNSLLVLATVFAVTRNLYEL